jgi:hypothetical protein
MFNSCGSDGILGCGTGGDGAVRSDRFRGRHAPFGWDLGWSELDPPNRQLGMRSHASSGSAASALLRVMRRFRKVSSPFFPLFFFVREPVRNPQILLLIVSAKFLYPAGLKWTLSGAKTFSRSASVSLVEPPLVPGGTPMIPPVESRTQKFLTPMAVHSFFRIARSFVIEWDICSAWSSSLTLPP